jgi:Ca2+:H+ antiporter
MLNWLLILIPVAIGVEYLTPERHLLVFVAAALAILPLAGWMGRATEALAERSGEGVGGLLNATFGNAAELIIALAALRAGLHDVVKASIAGSIVGNILLVLGAAMLAGGLRYPEQHFNASGARSQATLLTLAAIALILPAAYKATSSVHLPAGLGLLSVSISVVLLAVYALFLVFSLVTHKALFSGSFAPGHDAAHLASWSTTRARQCSPRRRCSSPGSAKSSLARSSRRRTSSASATSSWASLSWPSSATRRSMPRQYPQR